MRAMILIRACLIAIFVLYDSENAVIPASLIGHSRRQRLITDGIDKTDSEMLASLDQLFIKPSNKKTFHGGKSNEHIPKHNNNVKSNELIRKNNNSVKSNEHIRKNNNSVKSNEHSQKNNNIKTKQQHQQHEKAKYQGKNNTREKVAKKSSHFKDTILTIRKRWPLQIPYTTAELQSVQGNGIVRESLRDIEKKTCLTFIRRSNEPDYINFVDPPDTDGCFSFIGRQGGKQDVLLGKGCHTQPKAEHEIMHTLGSYHEHNRPDRDRFVRIIFKNIIPKFREQFQKRKRPPPWGKYDYGSMMHYGKWAFSVNKKPIMLPKKVNGRIYKGDFGVLNKHGGMTRHDAKTLNRYYGCDKIRKKPLVMPEIARGT